MDNEQLEKEKHFKRVIREHNKKTGFSFKLSGEVIASKYERPEHKGNGYRITSQIDTETETPYALILCVDDPVKAQVYIDGEMTREALEAIVKSEAWKNRVVALTQLQELRKELDEQVEAITNNMVGDSITEREKQDTYDTIMLAARKLFREV